MTTSEQLSETALRGRLADGSLAGHWTVDPSRSTVRLRSRSVWGLVPVKGVFHEVSGEGTVSPGGEVTGRVAVAAGSVDTGNRKRDVHLRSDDFFASHTYPEIVFGLDRITPSGDGVTVAGTLTVRERSLPISFPATVSVFGDGEVWLDGEVRVDRSAFGLTWSQLGMASMANLIAVHAVLTRG